jgi:hypothetical protein
MGKKKKLPKNRNPEAKKLESPLFRQRVVPKKDRPRDKGPDEKEWE